MSLMDKFKHSPVPQKVEEVTPISMSFGDAMGEIVNGKRVTRVEWNDNDEYFLLKDGYLMVHHSKQTVFNKLIVSEADLIATDWVILPQKVING